jgi:2-polyprenyl-3-methyl-5-hydroxy-6-metoxy-1,4-benzoquinol methylase
MVVIANFGTTNDKFLCQLLEEYRGMSFPVHLHVLTNITKDWGPDVTVHVGLPALNPRSLPFVHRRLFAEHIASADYFIYSEDDTLVSERNIRAFLDVSRVLRPDEIPGFLRVEDRPNGELCVTTAHGPYRWDPSSLVRRDSLAFASFTNYHSAFTMASRAQVQKAIASGGFLVPPHADRFAMLECAASDLYTQCGMTRLLCIDRLEDFLVHHLPNNYNHHLGVPYVELLEQTRSLLKLFANGAWKGTLLDVETRMPRGWASKNLYEIPDPGILSSVPEQAQTVLSIGSGWGAIEAALAKQGKQVIGMPIDGIFGDALKRRGIETVQGPFEEAIDQLEGSRFDLILMHDVIHLLSDPVQWLRRLAPLLKPGGLVLATAPRTFDPLRLVCYSWGEPAFALPKRFAKSGVQKVTRMALARWFAAAGMEANIQPVCQAPARVRLKSKFSGFGKHLFHDRFIVFGKVRGRVAAESFSAQNAAADRDSAPEAQCL